jgi:hypothetical protein
MVKKILVAFLIIAFLFATSLSGFLGMGDIVHDPISYANALLMLAELVRSYEQLKLQYELQVWHSTILPPELMINYHTPGAGWYRLETPSDQFSRLSEWLGAVNGYGSAWSGYAAASVPLQSYGGYIPKMSAEERERVGSHYASIELADGTNIHSMETVGELRANAEVVDRSLAALEADALSGDPLLNTEISVLNKINAASVASLRLGRDTNRLLLSNLEQQIAESKKRRDAEVSEMNTAIRRLQTGAELRSRHTSTLTQSLQGFRWR